MLRYMRALWVALRLTLRGQSPPPRPYARLRAWIDQTPALVAAIYAAADRNGLDKNARKVLLLKLDGRDMTVQTVLAAVEHHARQEYPYLLRHLTDHSITAIYASNLDDQYRVSRLRDSQLLPAGAARDALARLSAHLSAIPPSNDSKGD